MKIRDLKNEAAADNGRPIRLIKSDKIESKRQKELETVLEEPDLKEMKGIKFRKRTDEDRERARVSVDIKSDVPADEEVGIDIRESIEDDIFHSGGPFDQYKKEKMKEALQYLEEQRAEAEMEGKKVVFGGVDLKPIIPADDLEQAELDSYDESNKLNKQPSNITPISTEQNDPKFKFKLQEDDIFD